MDNLQIVIAGPGAGKTFSLKSEVINCLPNLHSHRFCAVITYTNAATEELRQRISSEVPLQPNIFVGTIHSFLIRFIIEPFGHLVSIVPMEKNYIDMPLVELHENYGKITQKALKTIPGIDSADAKEILKILTEKRLCSDKGKISRCFRLNDDKFKINLPPKYSSQEKEIIKALKNSCVFTAENRRGEIKRQSQYLAEKLSKNGIISYDTIIGLSTKIINDYPSALNIISRRLQFVFIDEYQDSRLYIHDIFKALLSAKGTAVDCFGDPLQAVYNFSYYESHLKEEKPPDSFKSTPMTEFQIKYAHKVKAKRINHRSSEDIVNFINRYFLVDDYKQTSQSGNNGIPVYFICNIIFSEIYSIYKQLKTDHNIGNIHNEKLAKSSKPFMKDLFLTKKWIDNPQSKRPKLINVYHVLNGEAARLGKGNHRVSSILHEVSRCILAVTGVKKSEFIKSTHDDLEYRKLCFKIARGLKSINFNDDNHRINYVRKQLSDKYAISNDYKKQVNDSKSLIELSYNASTSLSHSPKSYYSSIHSSKGLEATSVLVIAYSNNELEKWLDFQKANEILEDDYRLGYVAFSRARDMLCIACLEEISNETIRKLESLNVVFRRTKKCNN